MTYLYDKLLTGKIIEPQLLAKIVKFLLPKAFLSLSSLIFLLIFLIPTINLYTNIIYTFLLIISLTFLNQKNTISFPTKTKIAP